MRGIARGAFWGLNALAFLAAIAFAASLWFGDGEHFVLHPNVTATLLTAAAGLAILAVVALLLGFRTRWRWLAVLVLPVIAAGYAFETFFMPVWSDLAELTLRDGRTVHLGQRGILSGAAYDLWVEDDDGVVWRRVDLTLSRSEDGAFTGREALIPSRDGRRVLVLRGGFLTDCVRVAPAFSACTEVPPPPLYRKTGYADLVREHSMILFSQL
jgi:hypothetical protein